MDYQYNLKYFILTNLWVRAIITKVDFLYVLLGLRGATTKSPLGSETCVRTGFHTIPRVAATIHWHYLLNEIFGVRYYDQKSCGGSLFSGFLEISPT